MMESLDMASPILAAVTLAPALLVDPMVEAEVLNDFAHLALDVTTLVGPATLVLRLAAVVGRLFCIASDYIPDHRLLPEEWVFQLAMLLLASTGLAQSITPLLYQRQWAVRDLKCFLTLGAPAGLTWMQFKLLHKVALEWVQVPPGTIITSNERNVSNSNDLYWLYSGNVEMQAQGIALPHSVPAKSLHLLGDLTVLLSKQDVPLTVYAGPQGATLLKISTHELHQLMKNDPAMDKAIRNLLLQGMQERVAALQQSLLEE
jgi:hypothetical protein